MRMDKEMINDRPSDWMPELHDIPIGLVNTILYHKEQADITHKYVIPNNNNNNVHLNQHHHLHKNNNNASIINNNNSFTDTVDEMSEEDALALTARSRRRRSTHTGKRM
jgi:hypothetical protein